MRDGRLQRSDAHAFEALIVRRARELGAGDVRIAPAFPDDASRQRMRESFARGDLATWNYGEAYARDAPDPAHILAGARSVICLAFPYATRGPAREHLRGRVSNYAWSEDYHRRVRAVLSALAADIDALAGRGVTAIACDTKPLAERAFASRAGLGWIGKHTNLISPVLGSFVFLGEIVTTLELGTDAPLRKTCGNCSRCVDACPTGALRGDYTIDATRCIADLTQRTDGIPREMRALVGDWIWGCDICQVVCPPTVNAGLHAPVLAAAPRERETAGPSLVALLQLKSGEFKRRYAPTAMGWRGAAVLRRNAAVALGNSLDRSSVGALSRALAGDPHAMVRGHAAWALGRIGSPAALAALRNSLESERAHGVREEICAALETMQAVPSFLQT
ncbi:MAG: tRNA epoxyqueuosine(34) reductase QueG [Candidatus Eremiobacteraeota bacterium]|nr:tRNA epoxyqueuosine(34) reductase QueG [Candidatus Eremiobacteraeota bacterium]